MERCLSRETAHIFNLAAHPAAIMIREPQPYLKRLEAPEEALQADLAEAPQAEEAVSADLAEAPQAAAVQAEAGN